MIEAYLIGASSQTKWPASTITRRMGSRSLELGVDEQDYSVVAAAFRPSFASGNLPGQGQDIAGRGLPGSAMGATGSLAGTFRLVAASGLARQFLAGSVRQGPGPAHPASRTIVFGTGLIGVVWVVARKGWRLEAANEPRSGSTSETLRT
jgi:hypothetical protein